MKRRALVVALVPVITVGCSVPKPAVAPAPSTTVSSLRVQAGSGGVQRVPLEDYVAVSVVSESAPSGEPSAVERMFEVQAIVGRSFALASRGRHGNRGFDVCSTTHCQLYLPDRLKTSRWAPLVAEAVRRTAGVVIWHGTGPALALFHADCGGHTSTAAMAWGGADRPYLLGAPDGGPALSAHARWTYAIESDRMVELLRADPRTAVGARLDVISVLDRDPSGRAGTIALHGERERLVSGEILRDVVGRQAGPRTMRSTMFEVRRDQSRFIFEGRGFGHGVGLCQAGALARIRAGARPREVLEHYYAGTSLRTLD